MQGWLHGGTLQQLLKLGLGTALIETGVARQVVPAWNDMHARLQVLLCWLLFLWGGGKPSVGREGELCRAWSYGKAPGPSRGAFQCPQRQDRADAKYCCGNCRLPFCCSREETRLDWHRCRRALPNQAGVTRSRQTTPAVTEKPFAGQIAVFSFVALLLGIILWLVLCHCRDRYRQRQRALQLSNVFSNWSRRSFDLEGLLPPPLSHPRPPFPGTPPPYAEDPPPYSAEDPQGNSPQPPLLPAVHFHRASAENQEDEVTIGPLVHRNVPSHSSETDSLRDTSVDQ